MGDAVGRVVAHLFVDDLAHPEIDPSDRHHIERVLRVRPGETISVSDGQGSMRNCVFAPGGALEPAGDVVATVTTEPAITVGFAMIKGDRPEWIVQKLTECGVDRIVPFVASRSVVRVDGDRAARLHERLQRVAREAAMQSRQPRLPSIQELVSFGAAVAQAGPGALALADIDGDPPRADDTYVMVGPEGGWSPDEREGVGRFVRFGPSVLRSETAAVAVGIVLSALRSGVVLSVYPRAARSSNNISSQ